MRKCHRCGTEWDSIKRVLGVKEFCEKCSAYLHACLNCKHYNPAYHNQCGIPTTDWVGDKQGANFCDEFEFRDASAGDSTSAPSEAARSALDSLFGDVAQPSAEQKLDKFKDLFGD